MELETKLTTKLFKKYISSPCIMNFCPLEMPNYKKYDAVNQLITQYLNPLLILVAEF